MLTSQQIQSLASRDGARPVWEMICCWHLHDDAEPAAVPVAALAVAGTEHAGMAGGSADAGAAAPGTHVAAEAGTAVVDVAKVTKAPSNRPFHLQPTS